MKQAGQYLLDGQHCRSRHHICNQEQKKHHQQTDKQQIFFSVVAFIDLSACIHSSASRLTIHTPSSSTGIYFSKKVRRFSSGSTSAKSSG